MLGKKQSSLKLLAHNMKINLKVFSKFVEDRIMSDVQSGLIVTP